MFTDTSSSLLDNDEIRSAVANRAVDELFANVDVQAEVEEQLPEDYKGLSGAATAGLRQASYQIVDRALEQPVFQELFRVALEESHTTLVAGARGGRRPGLDRRGRGDRSTCGAIIIEAADRIGIGDQVVDRIPADAGQIVVLRSDELDTAQNVFQLLKTLAWVLPLLTLAAFGLAVWLAGDRRRRGPRNRLGRRRRRAPRSRRRSADEELRRRLARRAARRSRRRRATPGTSSPSSCAARSG